MGVPPVYSVEAYHNNPVYLVREDDSQDYFATAGSGILFLDAGLRVDNLNHEAEMLLGIDRDQLLGKRAEHVFQPFGEQFLNIFAASQYGDFYSTSVKIKAKEQSTFLHVDSMKLRSATGELVGIIIILQDMSALKATIKQIQTTQMLLSLGELAAGIAHHVRTPLTTISGYLQILLSRAENDRRLVRRDIFATMLDEVSYINHVIKELVLFAKPPVQKQAEVNINSIVDDALLLTFKQLGGEQIIIDKHWAKELPTITADTNLLKQAIVNIIQNAVEAMPDKGILSLKTWLHAELNMLVIAIADCGSGIAPQILPRVFEPFYTTKMDRIGLGLPIAHRILSEHGGFINISSDQSNGTKAHIYLPIVEGHPRQVSTLQQQIRNLQ
jgi:two-component system, NtrC family, sensor histidine kinase AtoS